MTAPLLVIAAGGTGGHMFPAQALAEVMLARGWRVKLSTDARGARYTGGFPEAVEIQQVSSATFARGGLVAKAIAPFRILGGVLGGIFGMLRDKPAISGIAVPGMPAGSPGMGDDPKAKFDVMAFGGDAKEGEVYYKAGVE